MARCRPRSAGRRAEPRAGWDGSGRRAAIRCPHSRAKCCGCTKAFQAFRAGSIPVARFGNRPDHLPRRAGRWRRSSVSADGRGNRVMIAAPRGVAQSGSAPGWGPGGRRFKSCLPDVGKAPLRRGFCLERDHRPHVRPVPSMYRLPEMRSLAAQQTRTGSRGEPLCVWGAGDLGPERAWISAADGNAGRSRPHRPPVREKAFSCVHYFAKNSYLLAIAPCRAAARLLC
jgi:hypothetical protein